jgi:hypothetical protein
MMEFSFHDRLSVPTELAASHATLPKQSINVLNTACTEENLLIRLLLGTVKIIHAASGKEITQNINYSVLGLPIVKARKYKFIQAALSTYEISTHDVDNLLRKTLNQRQYYAELLSESCNYFYRTIQGEHTLAFLHIYRFLEHISFAFPMLYAARTSDFSGAYAALKEYIGEEDKKELAFFRTFVNSSIHSDLREETSTFSFTSIPNPYKRTIYTAVKAQIDGESIKSSAPDTELVVKNEAILGLCINLRNRYFHFTATNRKNISTAAIGDPDTMFKIVNPAILNWLSIIYFETLKHRLRI